MKQLIKELPEDREKNHVLREWTYAGGAHNKRWILDTYRTPECDMQTVTEINKNRGGPHEHDYEQASIRCATLGTQHVPPEWDHGRTVDRESSQ